MAIHVQKKRLLAEVAVTRALATTAIAGVRRFGRFSWFRGRAVALVLGGGKIDGVGSHLLGLDSGSLGYTACNEVELGTVDKVLEVYARGEDDVDAGDVLGGELITALGSFAGEGDPEVAKFVEQHLLALKQLLHKTAACVGEYALHLSALVAAVLGDVVYKLTEGHHFLHLCPGISLRGFFLVHLVGKEKNRVIDHEIAHRRYGTWYLHRPSMCLCPAGS